MVDPVVLYLASRSPQRAKILTKAKVPFRVVETDCVEEDIRYPAAQLTALERATGKARHARLAGLDHAAHCVVLGADTVVALGRDVLGKPAGRDDAVAMLTRLAGTTHTVVTGHCCILVDGDGRPLKEARGLAITHVTMRSMRPAEIQAYVDSGESDDRAGAYAIQETGDRFVVDIQGSFDTVVGLSMSTVARLFREVTDANLPGYDPGTSPGSGGYRLPPFPWPGSGKHPIIGPS